MPRSEADSGRSAARAQQTRNPKMGRLCWLCLRPPDIHATAVHRTTLVDTLPHLTIYLQTAARKPALLENRTGVLLGLIRLGFFTTHCSCCGALVIQVRGTECDFRLRVSCMLLNCIEPDQRHSQLLPGPGDTPGSTARWHAGSGSALRPVRSCLRAPGRGRDLPKSQSPKVHSRAERSLCPRLEAGSQVPGALSAACEVWPH